MKRFSMAMTWLALAGLMTMVSCRKPVVGFTNGESRTVTVSAVTESGGGSKTAIEGLNVKWSKDDQIKMNGSVLTLEDECIGSTMGRFTGEVTGVGPYYIGYPADNTTYDNGTLKLNIPASWAYADMKEIVPMVAYAADVDDDVYFRNAVNMLKLQLKGDDTDASKLTSIVLTSTTSYLSGDISVTFDEGGNPTFNAIADGDGASKTMTVSFGAGLQLTADATDVYIPLAKIDGGDLTVRFNCANGKHMERKVTVTEKFNAVNNMLSAPELTVDTKPKFSVSETTTVEFAPGNLWYGKADGEETAAFHFEENQWDYSLGEWHDEDWYYDWDASHVSHFFWSKDAAEATKEKFDWEQPMSDEDVFFTNSTETTANPDFHVNGETGKNTWRILSRAELNYLLGWDPNYWEQTGAYGRPDAKVLCAWKELDEGTHCGYVILPDDTENPLTVLGGITKTSDLAAYGAVFLPAAGTRIGTAVSSVCLEGCYWSSTKGECPSPFSLYFCSSYVYTFYYGDSSYGYPVRLVR